MSKKLSPKKSATASLIKTKSKKTTVTAEDLFWEAYKEKQLEELLGDNSPSKIKSKVWLYAVNENAKYPLSTVDSGKWCVFVNKDEHDMWWGKIKEFLLKGGLGSSIKTNTAIENPNATSNK